MPLAFLVRDRKPPGQSLCTSRVPAWSVFPRGDEQRAGELPHQPSAVSGTRTLVFAHTHEMSQCLLLKLTFLTAFGDKSPPKLEPSDALPLPSNSETNSEPPTLKPVELNPEQSKLFKRVTFGNESHSTCTQSALVIGHPPEPTLASSGDAPAAASAVAEPSSDVNRRTSVLFCKSKSVSPPKSAKNTETQPTSPQLGTKTFLSVVLPRLETLLQPRKRSRSTCGDSEVEEGSPGKRLDTDREVRLLLRRLTEFEPRVRGAGWGGSVPGVHPGGDGSSPA
ncbi:hypothetical protein J1605_020549 [Eschrichtius robustus]|uniref:Uncharacterized protein n=1 Tax=Eschrichtius robustus TaxID=9764 RepID=A0AB34HL29_ESCRO|nr:hypothetical protein J1605_020549 [Eschrichtius robustus]